MRFALCAVLLAALGAGCVPVTEPLGDIEKAEPDKGLVGDWCEGGDTRVKIDVPAVKGNPKGLMRATGRDVGEDPCWFYVTKHGKHTYANVVVDGRQKDFKFGQFDKDGAFAEWQKEKVKTYFVFRYTTDGTKLAVDGGNADAFGKVTADAKIGRAKPDFFFETPAGWLAKYLDKNDPDKIYDGTNRPTYEKCKAK